MNSNDVALPPPTLVSFVGADEIRPSAAPDIECSFPHWSP